MRRGHNLANYIHEKMSPFWLVKSRTVFFLKTAQKRVNSVQKGETNQAFWLVNDQRNTDGQSNFVGLWKIYSWLFIPNSRNHVITYTKDHMLWVIFHSFPSAPSKQSLHSPLRLVFAYTFEFTSDHCHCCSWQLDGVHSIVCGHLLIVIIWPVRPRARFQCKSIEKIPVWGRT